MTSAMLGTWIADEMDYEWRDDVRHAMKAANLSDKEAAFLMGIEEPELSKALNLSRQWPGWRERRLPVAYHIALNTRRLKRYGYEVILLAELRELVTMAREVRQWIATHTKKRMARFREEAVTRTGTHG